MSVVIKLTGIFKLTQLKFITQCPTMLSSDLIAGVFAIVAVVALFVFGPFCMECLQKFQCGDKELDQIRRRQIDNRDRNMHEMNILSEQLKRFEVEALGRKNSPALTDTVAYKDIRGTVIKRKNDQLRSGRDILLNELEVERLHNEKQLQTQAASSKVGNTKAMKQDLSQYTPAKNNVVSTSGAERDYNNAIREMKEQNSYRIDEIRRQNEAYEMSLIADIQHEEDLSELCSNKVVMVDIPVQSFSNIMLDVMIVEEPKVRT